MSLEAYVLSLMVKSQSPENIPWGKTYATSAASIAKGVQKARRFFPGNRAEERAAAVMVSIGFFEGNLRPDAQGDCDKTDPKTGMCVPGSTPHSFCMFQINESNFKTLGVTKEELLSDFDKCVSAGIRMVLSSFSNCSSFPEIMWLNQYATGGPVCLEKVSKDKGEHRMRKAFWLFNNVKSTP